MSSPRNRGQRHHRYKRTATGCVEAPYVDMAVPRAAWRNNPFKRAATYFVHAPERHGYSEGRIAICLVDELDNEMAVLSAVQD